MLEKLVLIWASSFYGGKSRAAFSSTSSGAPRLSGCSCISAFRLIHKKVSPLLLSNGSSVLMLQEGKLLGVGRGQTHITIRLSFDSYSEGSGRVWIHYCTSVTPLQCMGSGTLRMSALSCTTQQFLSICESCAPQMWLFKKCHSDSLAVIWRINAAQFKKGNKLRTGANFFLLSRAFSVAAFTCWIMQLWPVQNNYKI